MNLYKEIVSKITPLDFEKYCLTVIKEYAEEENLNDFNIIHNKKIKKNDEDYQIDVFVEFMALKAKFKIFVECKRQKRPVERDEVILLNEKVQNLAAHKGILISTSGFQSGAIKRAEENGIALWQIIDKRIMFVRASISNIDEYYLEYIKHSPPHYVLQYGDSISEFPNRQIYPSKNMEIELRQKIDKILNRKNETSA
jgi:hypothetical protein